MCRFPAIALVLVIACSADPAATGQDAGLHASSDAHDGGLVDTPVDTGSPAPGGDTPFPPAKTLFEPDGIHTVALTTKPADWQTILADAADVKRPRTWHEASVTIDGVAYAKVAIKDYGDGSQVGNPAKPNVRIKFDELAPKQEGPEGVHNLRLKASGTDATHLREPLFFALLQAAGAPALRTSLARVTVNGAPHGLYQLMEHPDRTTAERILGSKPIGDYDPLEVCGGFDCPPQGCAKLASAYYTLDKGDGNEVVALASILATATDDQLVAKVNQFASWDELMAVHVVEAVASEVDGLSASGFNFEVFVDAKGKLHVLRYGADETFDEHYDLLHAWGPPNSMCKDRDVQFVDRVLAVPAWKAQWLAKMKALRCGAFEYHKVAAWVDAMRPHLRAEVANDPKSKVGVADTDSALDDLVSWVTNRNADLTLLVGPCGP